MADRDIPPPFRGPALDEPAPPEPPEIEPEEDDGDHGRHHHIHFIHPVVMLLSNGGLQTTGWKGSLLVGWGWLTSFVTIAVALWAGYTWLMVVRETVTMVFVVAVTVLVAVLSLNIGVRGLMRVMR